MRGAALARRVEEVVRVARPAGASVIVNDRVDVALAVGADGVHVGQDDLSVTDARRLAGRTLLVGVSTHDLDEARAAIEAGADYCGVGPMFETSTKIVSEPAGPAYLEAFIEQFPRTPHLAIGGIAPGNVGRLAKRGGQGVAVCAAVCGADRPGEVVKTLRAALES
jgi:thiamine-phosphate pyrophosphorylase